MPSESPNCKTTCVIKIHNMVTGKELIVLSLPSRDPWIVQALANHHFMLSVQHTNIAKAYTCAMNSLLWLEVWRLTCISKFLLHVWRRIWMIVVCKQQGFVVVSNGSTKRLRRNLYIGRYNINHFMYVIKWYNQQWFPLYHNTYLCTMV